MNRPLKIAVMSAALLTCAAGAAWMRSARLSAQAPAAAATDPAEQLAIHRNLGKAFYENPTTYAQSVEEFTKALALQPDSVRERVNLGLALLRAGKTPEAIAELLKAQELQPALPHTWFNLGITYKKEDEHEKAIAQFEKMVALAPTDAISQYNLGYLYRLTDKVAAALPHFEAAARLDPNLAGARFQLYNAYRAAGRAADAARELARFQELRRLQAGAAIPEDLDWSFYSEIYEPLEESPTLSTTAPSKPEFAAAELSAQADYERAGLVVLDYNADKRPDLLAWTDQGVALYRNGAERVPDSGLDNAGTIAGVAPGDFNNDGFVDLALLAADSVSLWANRNGKFEKLTTQLSSAPFNTKFNKAVWLDYDHDYDLDLILLGKASALARNNGSAGFSDMSRDFPFVKGEAIDAVQMDVIAYDNAFDLAVAYQDRAGVIYRDRLGGQYEVTPGLPEATPAIPEATRHLIAHDWNNDGWTDLAVSHLEYPSLREFGDELESSRMARTGSYQVLLLRNKEGVLQQEEQSISLASSFPAFVDFDNRGLADLISAAEGRLFTKANQGGAFSSENDFLEQGQIASRVSSADWDQDGKTDLATIGFGGAVERQRNETEPAGAWLTVSLEGVKNLKLAPGARVEVRAGRMYQKRTYAGVPLTFGLGPLGNTKLIDTVRITWPNGLIQNETKVAVNQHVTYKEAQRLSGSCPMIFTWNGKEFEFITDVLGVAPLGASLGDGQYFPVDHDEFIQIPGRALTAVNGKYEVRITEELREVAYFDEVKLIAVDHPANVEIFTNDKFKSPPFPEFRLFGVERRIYPKTARDHRGNDVLPQLRKLDKTYPDQFRRDLSGLAERHHIDLDFGNAAKNNSAVLVLNGWLDWADGSTFRAVSQEMSATPGGGNSGLGGDLALPYLQVKNARREWQTVIEDMGIPAGKPKTIAVDLTGKFLSASREVRIVTGMALYWDEIFLSEANGAAAAPLSAKMSDVALASVDLQFRGWSRPIIHPERKQPEHFDYQQWMPTTMWNPTQGLYTRYGDVKTLLTSMDDKLVLMGSGDEMRFLFDAASLPPLPVGWQRDFLLKVDGWAKDQDANTAFATSVEPLPFHGMSQYPYPANEHFPDTEEHREYRRIYNTRPALRVVRPLAPTPITRTSSANTSVPDFPEVAALSAPAPNAGDQPGGQQ
ncbi:MAG: tetratricopeptide repeat protein [Acidobacteria bacterium]|nr:tetratricopeptide repeat protein [Acidobacteriota bacterium]